MHDLSSLRFQLNAKARRVVPAMWVVVASTLVAGVGEFGAFYAADSGTFDLSVRILVVGYLAILVASLVTAVLWFGWASGLRRLLTSSGTTLKHSSAALFWWFVCPVANLFMPQRVYLELAESVGGGPAAKAVRAWWIPWVLYVALGYFSGLILQFTFELDFLVTFAAATLLGFAAIRAREMMAALGAAALRASESPTGTKT